MLTMRSALDRAVRLYAANTAIVDAEGTFTWAEFLDRVRRAAGMLQSLGVRQGDRFGILSRNTFRHAEIIHAGYWMGAVPVPVNIRLAPPEIAFILDDAGCEVVLAEDVFADLVNAEEFDRWRDRVGNARSLPRERRRALSIARARARTWSRRWNEARRDAVAGARAT